MLKIKKGHKSNHRLLMLKLALSLAEMQILTLKINKIIQNLEADVSVAVNPDMHINNQFEIS
jgi:hypothetical protein